VFSSVYRFIDRAGSRRFQLWPTVKQELRTMAALAPLLVAHLRAPWHGTVLATDASMDGIGIVATNTPADATALAARYPIREPLPDSVHAFLESAQWRTIVSAFWRRPEHINVLELRAVHAALRWCLSRPSALGSRLLMFSDSSVVVGAVSKGRSSSPGLLRVLRTIAAHVLASGTSLTVRWLPSAANPADGPSRGQ
jgi:hypothetical protein